MQNKKFNFLLDLNNEKLAVKQGEIEVPIHFMVERDLHIGEILTVTTEDYTSLSAVRLTGTELTVLVCNRFPTTETMLKITREMKQYETIFLRKTADCEYRARIFTKDEELDFAGHLIWAPVL